MDSSKFIEMCKKAVAKYTNDHLSNDKKIDEDEVYVVWNCKTLQNNKALLSTPIPDHMYYECTYNGDKNEMYFDAYKKEGNICIKL